jgi:hypothetical protein
MLKPLHANARRRKLRSAAYCERIRIGNGEHNFSDSCGDQGIAARTSSPTMCAWFERHNRSSSTRAPASCGKRGNLCVGLAPPTVVAIGNDLAVRCGDDTSDHWIRLRTAVTARGKAHGSIKQNANALGSHALAPAKEP